jgi:hypothetical protein
MQKVATRPWTTAGVALAGASLIAATPVTVPLPDVQARDIALAAFDPITPFVDAFNTASANATTIADTYFIAPFPVLQQVIVNQFGYLGDVINNPASIGDVFGDIGTNLQNVLAATVLLGASDTLAGQVLPTTLDSFHTDLVELLPSSTGLLQDILTLSQSPLSGILIGLAGPLISPAVAFGSSIAEAIGALTGGDPLTGLEDLINTPANVLNGFLNGATLNLDSLIPLAEQTGLLPTTIEAFGLTVGLDYTNLDLAFGGLLTPGETEQGIGGSIFNSLGLAANLTIDGEPLGTLTVDGQGVGPLGALTSFTQLLASVIGWDGTGNPLTQLTFPTIDPGDLLSGLTSSLDGDLSTLLGGSAPEIGTLTTDILTGLTSLF